MISIIIPTYNAADTIEKILDSIVNSDGFEDCEALVIDDASTDGTAEKADSYPVRVIRSNTNGGSAQARNRGVKNAGGDTIVFFDADVILHADTLQKLIAGFHKLENGNALIGIYSKKSVNRGFVPEFKALLDFYHWLVVEDQTVTAFEPRCAIIGKNTFEDIGGFDEKIKGADVEDYEFGYRLLNKGKIHLDKSIQVDHHFPTRFSSLAKNFFNRGTSWIQLFIKRKQFDNVATTKEAGLSCGFAFLSSFFLAGALVSNISAYLFLISFFLFLYFYRRFFIFIFREKKIVFCIKSILVQYTLNIIVGFAAVKGILLYFAGGASHAKD